MSLSKSAITLAAACMAAIFGLATAATAETATFEVAKFEQAQAKGAHIVVEVFKKGCPTCKLQQPGLKEARAKFPNATFMTIDFEGDASLIKRFKLVKQSTILVFKGDKEVARVVGETDKDAIVATVAKGA